MTTKTIDYSAFPHIVDSILSYADWSVLIQTRQTCKTLKTRVESLMCEKLNLHPSMNGLWVLTTEGKSIPGLKEINLDPEPFEEQLERILTYTKHTTMVELKGLIATKFDARIAAPAFPNLETYRIVPCRHSRTYTPYFPFPCKTLVLFYTQRGPLGMLKDDLDEILDYFESLDDDMDNDQPNPWDEIEEVPEGVTKIVVNMSGSNTPVADFFNVLDLPDSVKEFVIVFPKYKALQRRGTFSNIDITPMVIDTCDLIETNDAHHVLVGLDELGPSCDFVHALRHQVLHHMDIEGPQSPEEYLEELLKHVAILSKDEYAKVTADIDLDVVQHLSCHDLDEYCVNSDIDNDFFDHYEFDNDDLYDDTYDVDSGEDDL